MDNKIYGLEIIRAYELSWLNTSGKPQLGILEVKQDFGSPEINTWKLKSFLESINNLSYSNVGAVNKAIYEFIKLDNFEIITQPNFSKIEFFEQLTVPNFNCKISDGLRFICQHTMQPHIGTVNIMASNSRSLDKIAVNNIISAFRNKAFVPQALVHDVFNALQKHIQNDFILSVHLNRRGGISYQALCSNIATDFSLLCKRSILE